MSVTKLANWQAVVEYAAEYGQLQAGESAEAAAQALVVSGEVVAVEGAGYVAGTTE